MSNIDEIKNSFKTNLYDRISSPLYGTFIASWSVWNWKIIWVTIFVSEKHLHSNNVILNKVDYIVTFYCNWIDNFIIPLMLTGLFIWLVPYISELAYKAHLKFSHSKLKLKQKTEGFQLLNVRQSNAIKRNMIEQEKITFDAINNKDKIISNHKYEISELENELTEAKTLITALNDKYNEREEELITADIISKLLNDMTVKEKTKLANLQNTI